jgi:hypothetical protein
MQPSRVTANNDTFRGSREVEVLYKFGRIVETYLFIKSGLYIDSKILKNREVVYFYDLRKSVSRAN